MKDLLLCIHVVIKTLNLEISRCHLARYVTELYKNACRTCSTIIFPHSTNQIIVFWRHHCRWCRPCLSSLIGSLRNHDDNGNKNVANLCIWQWKTIDFHALHVQFSFLYISQLSRSFHDVKWPVLPLCGRREHMMTNVQFYLLTYEALVAI